MSYNLMFNKAIELQNNGALNEAEDIYLNLLQLTPENADLWNLLGLIAQSKCDFKRAVDCFLKAIKYAPTPFALHFFNLGLSYKALNLFKEAKDAFERCVTLAPEIKEGWLYFGILLAETKELKEAIKCFCKALELDAGYTDARAYLCFYTNDKESLIKTADEDYSNFTAQLLCGKLTLEEKYLQRAVDCAPYNPLGLAELAKCKRNRRLYEEALKLYHKILYVEENNLEAVLGIADMELELGHDDKAETYYQKSFEITRECAGAYLNYGILLYRQHRLAEALNMYRQAVILAPDIPEISYNLALVLKETGEYEEALGLMFNAHLKNPQKEEFTVNLAETLAELFETNAELALKIAQNWQKNEPDNVFSKRILAGLSGTREFEDNPQYAEQLFDVFAETYEDTLAKLNPKIITEFKRLNPKLCGHVLDLGCGTGLAAEYLKNGNTTFDGVDVSAKMLDIAKEKNLYQTLIKADICDFVAQKKNLKTYDLVVAFDVFCYIGNLRPILINLKGKKIWFSTENMPDDRREAYFMTPCGRYKHKKESVIRLLQELGFKQIKSYDFVLRQEKNEDVNGTLFTAEG